MSRFTKKLKHLRAAAQPIGFRSTQPAQAKPKIQLVARLAGESITGAAGTDALILETGRTPTIKTLKQLTQGLADLPWGCQLQAGAQQGVEPVLKAGGDFVIFPADTPLATVPEGLGVILEMEADLNEGLLRAANQLAVDAVLIAAEEKEAPLTWQHLLLFQRFSDLLTKPLLVSTKSKPTATELQALWEAGINGVVIEISAPPGDTVKELREVIDGLDFPLASRQEKVEPRLPQIGLTSEINTSEEDEEE